MSKDLHYLVKMTDNKFPEYKFGGNNVRIIPGFDDWIMVQVIDGKIPPNSIPASDVVKFLNTK